ncbi:MAG: immunity 49 family protein [Gordonia sp. (in: high G+C Gram-positive bacteria)]|uniref:immunity 49 family protein n=1 Tax=Gordonia sp. (in: high G+C Gram-positive bacteria) TaxID=84139 RepID=UPI0039E715AB
MRALQSRARDEFTWFDLAAAAVEAAAVAPEDVREEALYLDVPVIGLIVAIGDQEAFTEQLGSALEAHRAYYSKNEYRTCRSDGFVSIPILAACCMAIDDGMTIDIETDYLPRYLLDHPAWMFELDDTEVFSSGLANGVRVDDGVGPNACGSMQPFHYTATPPIPDTNPADGGLERLSVADAEFRYASGAELCVTADNASDVKPFYEQWSLHIRPGSSGVDDCYVTAYYYEATGTLSRIVRFEPHDRRLFLVEDTVYLYEDNELPHQSVDSAEDIASATFTLDGDLKVVTTTVYDGDLGPDVLEYTNIDTSGLWFDRPAFGDWGRLLPEPEDLPDPEEGVLVRHTGKKPLR